MRLPVVLLTVGVAFTALGCQMPQPGDPSSAGSYGSSDPRTTAASPNSGGPAGLQAPKSPGTAPTSSAPIPTTIELHSDCSRTLPVFYGEKPKFGSGTKSSIGSNTTTSVGRNGDGTLTIWIIDEQENGIASVHVTPDTKRVEIDGSCSSIRAH
jgi:hypothetical protein